MNQRCEPDSKTNTETLEQTKSTRQPRRARQMTKCLIHGFLQDLRQNGVGRVFERVNMMQENNWLIRLNDKAILKESLHNQKLHRVLFVHVTLLDYILGAFVKSRATWCPRGLGTAGLMSRDLYLGEADVGALFIE